MDNVNFLDFDPSQVNYLPSGGNEKELFIERVNQNFVSIVTLVALTGA